MMFTVSDSEIVGGVTPGYALQVSVYVTWPSIGLDVLPSAPEDNPVHESPFVPETAHDTTLSTFQ